MMEQDQFYAKYRGLVPTRLKTTSPRTILIWVVVGAIALYLAYLLISWLFFSSQPKQAPPPPPVRVATAVSRNVPVTVKTIGTVLANATVDVKPRIDGQIIAVAFKEGQLVKPGDLLFQLDPAPAEQALRQAQAVLARDSAQLVSARAIADRTTRLTQIGAASAQDRDIAIGNADALAGTVQADQASVQAAQLTLSYTQIRSPLGGKTGPVLLQAGNLVHAADTSPLVEITQLQPVKITFALPQADLPQLQDALRTGSLTALLRVRNDTGAPLPDSDRADIAVKVDFIGNVVNEQTGTVELRATFDNPEMRLVPGELVDVTVQIAVVANAVEVPRDAINAGQNGAYVFVIDHGHAQMHNVTVVYQDETIAATTAGLKPGEVVVTDGQLRLNPGSAVTIFKDQPGQAPPQNQAQNQPP